MQKYDGDHPLDQPCETPASSNARHMSLPLRHVGRHWLPALEDLLA
jgi:hypothetical protein